MPTTGTEILSYRGDPGLGSGSNPQIPVSATKDLDTINRTGQILLYQNMAQNKALFDQKIKDRDTLLQAIDSGDIQVGDLLEEDEPYVKEGLEKLTEAYFNRIKKGINDIDAAREYKKELREAQSRVTQAQGRKVFYDTESQVLAKETLPRKQEARRKNLDNVIKGGFWKDITPYQQTQDLDIEKDILSTAKNVTTEFTDPKTLTKGKRTVFDYDATKLANEDNFLNDVEKRQSQQLLLQEIQSLPATEFTEAIRAINNRIKEHNDLYGQNIEPVKVEMRNGRPNIAERLPDFAAKYTLAHQKPFESLSTEFDKDRATYELGLERNRIAAMKGRAYVDNLRQQMSIRKTQQEKDAYLDEQWVRNFTNQESLIIGLGGDKFKLKDIDADDSLPIYTIKNGKVTELVPIGATAVTDDKGNLRYYKGGHWKTQYTMNGKTIAPQTMADIYDNMKKQQGDKWQGSFDDFLKLAIANKKFRVTLGGQNGTSDEEFSRAAQQLISNQGTKKGQVGVFDNSEEPVDEDQVQEIQTNTQREKERENQ